MFTYQQATGKLLRDDVLLGVGYSGFGDGKNNPDQQHVRRVGPIPRGLWHMSLLVDNDGNPCDHVDVNGARLKAPVIRLTPQRSTETYGRDGFLMHGDSVSHPGKASLGCMVQAREIRELVVSRIKSGEDTLEVVHG